jgi:hypothetical protein
VARDRCCYSEGTSKQLLAVALGTGNSNVVGMLLRGMVTLAIIQVLLQPDYLYIYLRMLVKLLQQRPLVASDIVRIVGYSIDGPKVWFDPSPNYIQL